MIVTLGLVSAICGLIIVGAYQGTCRRCGEPRLALERTVFKVLPTAKSMTEWHRRLAGRSKSAGRGRRSTRAR
jgi:electron transport complex protein RnfG